MSKNIFYAISGIMIAHGGISFAGLKEDTETMLNKNITEFIEKFQFAEQCKMKNFNLSGMMEKHSDYYWFKSNINDKVLRSCFCQAGILFSKRDADGLGGEEKRKGDYLDKCRAVAWEATDKIYNNVKYVDQKINAEIKNKEEEAKRVMAEEKAIAKKLAEDEKIAEKEAKDREIKQIEANRKQTEIKAVTDAGLTSNQAILWMNRPGLGRFSRGNIDPNEGFATLWYEAKNIASQSPKVNP